MGLFDAGFFVPGHFPPGYFADDGTTPAYLPADLAEAIGVRFVAGGAATGVGGLYMSEAGEAPPAVYAVFTIPASPSYYTSSTSRWHNTRVEFKVHAPTQGQADDARDALGRLYAVGDFEYRGGYSIPFFEEDRSERKAPGWGRGTARVFAATLVYSARCKRS